jgi:hypothetical protein
MLEPIAAAALRQVLNEPVVAELLPWQLQLLLVHSSELGLMLLVLVQVSSSASF